MATVWKQVRNNPAIRNDEPQKLLDADQQLSKSTDIASNSRQGDASPAYLEMIQPKSQRADTTPDVAANEIDFILPVEYKLFFADAVM